VSGAIAIFTKKRRSAICPSALTAGFSAPTTGRRSWSVSPRQELEGLPVADLFGDTPAGKTRDAESFQRFLAGEELSGLEVEMRRKDGRPLWISLWMRPIRGADGKVQASRSIWVDITDRVLAEAERARLQQQNLYLEDEIKAAHNFEELIGQSPRSRPCSTRSAASPPRTPPC
jgi:PAS domain S-box